MCLPLRLSLVQEQDRYILSRQKSHTALLHLGGQAMRGYRLRSIMPFHHLDQVKF